MVKKDSPRPRNGGGTDANETPLLRLAIHRSSLIPSPDAITYLREHLPVAMTPKEICDSPVFS
jgi:hypothetical protein